MKLTNLKLPTLNFNVQHGRCGGQRDHTSATGRVHVALLPCRTLSIVKHRACWPEVLTFEPKDLLLTLQQFPEDLFVLEKRAFQALSSSGGVFTAQASGRKRLPMLKI